MFIPLTCSCGNRMRVDDRYAGQTVRCTACGDPLVIENAAPSEDASFVRFSCGQCGRPMQARTEYAGRQTRCPDCQATVTIAVPRPAAAVPAAVPSLGPSRGYGSSLPSIPDLRRPPNRSGWWILLGGAGVMALAVAACLLLWWRFGPDHTRDLDLIPADANALISLRIGDTWKQPLVQRILAASPLLAQIRGLGAGGDMGFQDIERFTIVFEDFGQQTFWGTLQFNRSINERDFWRGMRAQADGPLIEKQAGRRTYLLGKMRDPGFGMDQETVAFSLYNDRLFIFGTEAAIVQVLERGTDVNKEGPLESVLARAAGPDQLVIGVATPNKELQPEVANLPDPLDKRLEALGDAHQILLIGNLNQNFDIEVTISLSDVKKAEELTKGLADTKKEAAILVGTLKLLAIGNAQALKLVKLVETAIGKGTVVQHGTEVSVKMALEGEGLIDAAR